MGQHRPHYPLSAMCAALGVTRAGYYAWVKRRRSPPGPRECRREELAERVRAAYEQSRCTYGSPRVYHELKAQGVECCENTVAKLMRQQGIRSIVRRRFKVRTTDSAHEHPVAPDVLGRDFSADAPGRKWAADITYVATGQGWPGLAVPGGGAGPVQPQGDRVGHGRPPAGTAVPRRAGHGAGAAAAGGGRRPRPPQRPGRAVRLRRLPRPVARTWHRVLDEPPRRLLRQRGGGELLQDTERRSWSTTSTTRRGSRPAARSSSTSRCSITAGGCTRAWATSAPSSSRRR